MHLPWWMKLFLVPWGLFWAAAFALRATWSWIKGLFS
jgi:hypothetical protein